MPDLTAGTTVRALDTPPTVTDEEAVTLTFNSTTYGIDADTGVYTACGVVFTAPTTGRVLIWYDALMANSVAGSGTRASPAVRLGSTIGSGSLVLAAADISSILVSTTSGLRFGGHKMLPGLTPGTTYNAQIEHRVTANIGTISNRTITVQPTT